MNKKRANKDTKTHLFEVKNYEQIKILKHIYLK